jgi:ribosome-binding factor A
VREIVAEELEAIDDERLEGVVVTSVEVDSEIRTGVVYWDSRYGEEADEEVLEALGEHRVRLQASINRQAHLRRTPELSFVPDPAVREGAHIEELLATVVLPDEDDHEAEEGPGGVGPPETPEP